MPGRKKEKKRKRNDIQNKIPLDFWGLSNLFMQNFILFYFILTHTHSHISKLQLF